MCSIPATNEHVGLSLNESVFSLLEDQPLPTLILSVCNRNVVLALLVVFQKLTFSHGLLGGEGNLPSQKSFLDSPELQGCLFIQILLCSSLPIF